MRFRFVRIDLLVFDQRHITAGNEQVARRAAEAFLKARVRPSDRVAVIGIPGPGPQLGFTADRTRAATLWPLLAVPAVYPDTLLPATGLPLPMERALSAAYIDLPEYGTRCSTVLTRS